MGDEQIVCVRCGVAYGVGQSPYCQDAHDFVAGYHPFTPYFDFALGREITSHAERWKAMKELHVDYRDKMSAGDLSARQDRVHAEQKERTRG